MKVGIIGLGKMGWNILLNLQEKNVDVVGYDASESVRKKAFQENLPVQNSLDALLNFLEEKKIVMLSTPAGEVTNTLIKTLSNKLNPGDIIIDAGNSYYKDSVKNFELAQEKGIEFLDCGTSGGIEGARNGACLMVGGKKETFDQVEEIFSKLACEKGYLFTGKPGSGHYLKMIHNGIEYGMLQAIGEGFDVLNASKYEYDFEKVASVWNHGSVIRSWLIELAEKSFEDDPKLDNLRGVVDASGEGKWTVEEALDLNIPVPVIASSLFTRNASKINDSFSAKVVSTIRHQFGGHEIVENKE
ncbi:phosphogluconate dehydrogenase (NAD(+)-dependent, decarboxylating) [Caldifermentibacillus hisashii]|jgi:6-phosphogluconate dehydrogenase|uniref:phosphogluconate dehydrogenase (NAD(+)-dependent, decarboxylating) n=1 Tax=Caldifermentibacillus hisashii TaxID=996558 RepID=UPI001C102464|nr:decarboxylating 6-phosphogluconate dehydrogenase [Caldifermentibacillus hisashii]MBU5343392.1 decarboxylating 6-phosphogluconate dehydrogenase [Caldifermentibacillus hisashii]